MIGIGVLAAVSATLLEDLLQGAPPSAAVASVAATCVASSGASCEAVAIRLNPGRFHLRTRQPASSLSLSFSLAGDAPSPRVLLIRSRGVGRVIVGQDQFLVPKPNARTIVRLPANGRPWGRVVFAPADASQPIVLDELGLFETDGGLLRPRGQPIQWIPAWSFYNLLLVLAGLGVCGLVVWAGFAASDVMRQYGPWLLGALCVVVCLLEIQTNFSPYWKYDLRSFYASETIESGNDGNLTGGLLVGLRAANGRGLTYQPSQVEWHRMPGYGLFCAAAATLARTQDVVELAMAVIVLQVALYGVSVALFVAVAPRLFSVGVSYLLGVLLMLLPKQLHYTQSDSVIAPIAILLAAALVICLAQLARTRSVSLGAFLLANAAFALWFLMRNDVLPGWFVVSSVLAARQLRYLVVPAALAVTIAGTWATYKRPYRHEFDLLPTNTGEVLLLSLCDVPNALRGPCTDDFYLDWAARVSPGTDATSQRASGRAVAEVLRYWITYPVHAALMVLTKLDQCLTEQFWSGVFTRFNKIFGIARATFAAVWLVGLTLAALAVGHERQRVFVLGWALFLNMPLYFVVWASNGRFYAPAGVSLLTAAIPLCFERSFVDRVRRHRRRVAVIACALVVFMLASTPVETWVVRHPRVHYWAPLLDPRASSLAVP